ncbi:MAG: TadE/TadG family type IV pilus assembly protein [Sphingomonadales bacterium]
MSVCSIPRKLLRARDGATAVEFAIIAPVVLLLSAGIMEFTILMFDYHRAGEAARRGARIASFQTAIGRLDNLADGATVTCSASGGGGVTCTNGPVVVDQTFFTILAAMREIMPEIEGENLTVSYAPSGIGDITTPGGIKPRVTVELEGLEHDFILFGGFTGLPDSLLLPSFSTTVIGIGYSTS